MEYVYNVPWVLKTFDGREKSLLRAATRDLLPDPILQRRKAFFPWTQHVCYITALQNQLRDVLADASHSVFEVFSRPAVQMLADAPSETWVGVTGFHRGLIQRMWAERVLSVHMWLDLYRPRLCLA